MKTFATLIAVLALAISANAQTPATTAATAAPATASCEIVKILQGGVIEVGKEPTSIVVKTKGCETEISSISADGLEFSDVTFKANRLTTQVKATDALGAVSFKIKDKDSNEISSPDAVYILVLDVADAHVKAIADKTAATTAMTSKRVKALETRVETVSTTRPTRDEVALAISPLRAEILARPTNAEVVAFVAPYEARIATLESKVAALAQATVALAEGEVALGNTKRGIFRRKLNPQVAEMAEQIRQAFMPAPTPVAAANN